MMKLITLAALLVSACGPATLRERNIEKWTDPETGCVYLNYGGGIGNTQYGSLSIRFRADGTPDCPGKEQGS